MNAAFINRNDAGRQLGFALAATRPPDPVIVGLCCGGVPVAAEIAHILAAPMDICIVRRLMHGDLTIGAVSENGIYLDDATVARHIISHREVDAAIEREIAAVVQCTERMRDEPPLSVLGRDVILVDDGVTTGATIRAAAIGLRKRRARTLSLAVPVASIWVLDSLRAEFEHITCLDAEPITGSIGARYQQFLPVSEAEVVATVLLLRPAKEHALSL